MPNWMNQLTRHYDKMRSAHPEDELLIVFDIDNTIVDMRQMIVRVLRGYDQAHGSDHFKSLDADAITINENQVDQLLDQMGIVEPERQKIHDWYLEQRWSSDAILESHRPFAGVMEVIRWFQIQPHTHVALNTGRTESLRADTLRSLNALGAEYKVRFEDGLLHMNPDPGGSATESSKVVGIRKFQDAGYHVVAVVDNEPENLKVIADADPEGRMLMVHADTIFDSKRSRLPESSVSGRDYDLTELISERRLPTHVQFVWHGVNDVANLRQFLGSNVQWAELDVRLDPESGEVILRHDDFDRVPRGDGEQPLLLRNVVEQLLTLKKSLKIDFKEEGPLSDRVIELLRNAEVDEAALWFNGSTNDFDQSFFRRLSAAFPGAILQCPIGFMAADIVAGSDEAHARVEEFRSWGVNRLSIAYGVAGIARVLDRADSWGFDVNIYNVPDLSAFLKAVLLRPRSVTSDFNFPKWHYFGRGAGGDGGHHSYTLDDPKDPSRTK